jgi:hypothetical protein
MSFFSKILRKMTSEIPLLVVNNRKKRKYIQDKDFDADQKVLQVVSHHYFDIINEAKDRIDEE